MEENLYEDILHTPHHRSEKYPPMPRRERAAQFSPFAALSGYDEAVSEAARCTEERIEPDENVLEELDRTLRLIESRSEMQAQVTVTFFRPDDRKAGGSYQTRVGTIRMVDRSRERLCLTDGTEIPLREVLKLSAQAENGSE